MFPAGDAVHEVHIGSAMPLCLFPELVSEEQAEEDGDRHVVGDEGRGVPITLEEDIPVGEEDDEDGPDQAPPSGIWHELAVPWKVLGVDPLRLQTMSESDTSDTDAEPIEHSRDGAHVGEPAENVARGLGDGHVGEASERGAESQRVDGRSLGVGAGEDLGGLTGLGETVQGTGRGVQIGRASRPSRG
jgi:hypothetical protein